MTVLLSRPCLLPSIYDILLRFRIGIIGIVSDIQQAFVNIEITSNIVIYCIFMVERYGCGQTIICHTKI